MHFLECSVYVIDDNADALGDRIAFLVEKQLDVCRYKKWNDNRGGLNGLEPTLCLAPQNAPLEAILESGDDDDFGDDGGGCGEVAFTDDEIPQAFSHFTYRFTKRRLLVCDLQGVLTTTADGSDHRRQFEFTDPVVHYKSRTGRSNVFGRTDLGQRGMRAFLKTHVCGHLCRSLTRRWVGGWARRNDDETDH